jgi:hypothetical protein
MDDLKAIEQGPAVPAETMRAFGDVVPVVLRETWETHGFATTLGGFVRFVDPAPLVDLIAETSAGFDGAIPLFTTALGDIGVLRGGYVSVMKYRHGRTSVLTSRPEWLLKVMGVPLTREEPDHLDWQPYPEAAERLGRPAADQCFGYAPLLVMGGPETADHLSIVSLREHLLLISGFAGPLY